MPALTGASPHRCQPPHVRAPACTGPLMPKPFAVDLARWLCRSAICSVSRAYIDAFRRRPCTLAVSVDQWTSAAEAPLGSAGSVLAALRRSEALGGAGGAWWHLDALERARIGLDGPAQACIPHSERYIYNSCYRSILKGFGPISILKTVPNSLF